MRHPSDGRRFASTRLKPANPLPSSRYQRRYGARFHDRTLAGKRHRGCVCHGAHRIVSFITANVLIGLAVLEAGCVLVWISLAIARRDYQRIGPEADIRARVTELRAYYDRGGIRGEQQDRELLKDTGQMLLDSYTATTPANRVINQRRYELRARAASHLIRSLIWALGATTVIFVAEKLRYLPKLNV